MIRSNNIEAIKFVDAYRTLGHADVGRYGDSLDRIRNNPRTLAGALVKVNLVNSVGGGMK